MSTVTPTTQSISDRFSIGGIVLTDLILTVTYTWAVPAQGKPQTLPFTLGGHVQLGTGQGALPCATTLALVSGAPVLFDVALDADFSLGAFLPQCLTGNEANWPVGFIDLTLLSGTRIYYYDQAADDSAHSHSTLDGITFQPGFNVDARIRLTQVTSITLHGVLTVLTDQTTGRLHRRPGRDPDRQPAQPGLRADREHHPARTGPALHPAARSPSRPARRPRSCCAPGSTSWGQRDQGLRRRHDHEGHADRGPAAGPVSARWAAASPTPATPNSDGEFRHRRMAGFHLGAQADQLRRGDQGPGDTSGGSPCGTLGDFIVTDAYSSSFSVSPSVSVSGTNLVFAVTGTYALTLAGASSPFVSVTMPAFSMPNPSTTRWGNLPRGAGRRLHHRRPRILPATC